MQTRRKFLATGAAAAVALAGCGRRTAPKRVDVAVVGGGLAGLVATHRLRAAGVDAHLYEGAVRLGGRCFTLRDEAGRAVGEHGGQFVDSTHAELRALVDELGLGLTDLEETEGRPAALLGGRRVEPAAIDEAYEEAAAAIADDLRALRTGAAWNASSPESVALDRMTAAEWIERRIEGGARSVLGRSLSISLTTLNGLDPDELSAISALYLFVGDSDERFVITGGSDAVVTALLGRIGDGAIVDRTPLVAARRAGDDALLVFEDGAGTREVRARRAVLALPFTRLRACDLAGAGLAERTMRVIRELPMGTNAKLHLAVERDPWWRRGGWSGDGQSDELQTTWDELLGDPDGAGRLLQYTGGRTGATLLADAPAHGPVDAARAAAATAAFGELFGADPGPAAPAYLDRWADDPWTRGSYSTYRAGQWTEIAGYAGRAEPPFHFAGEHTSVWQGYLNGAVESGERVARELLDG